jgi:hypothetical protein
MKANPESLAGQAIPIPPECGEVSSMCEYRGNVYLACENGVFKVDPKTKTLTYFADFFPAVST